MIYLANDSIHYQTVFIPRQSYQSGTTRNPDYGSGLTSGDVINLITQSDAFERVVYDPTTKRIYFYNGEGTPATTSVDCTDFIKDGMVSEVKIENGYLIIVFNTDSGKENISIPLTDIFNPDNYYTKTETDSKLSEKQNNLVSGQNIKTINKQSILGQGNIEIKGTEYEAGENIDITGRVISVTGITIPTKTSDLINDSNFVDNSTVESAITEAISGIPTEFKTVNRETITGEGNIEIDVPTKTSELINDSGFLTEHQSLSAYSTTVEVQEMINSAKTEVEAEIPDVSQFITSGQAQSQIDGAITTETARTENVYAKKTDIPVVPTKTSELTNDSGFITEDALAGYATEEWVEGKGYLTEHQSLSAYSTTEEMNTAISSATQDMATTGDLSTLKTEIESEIPDVSNFITSGQAQSQIDSAITSETARTESTYLKEHQSLSAYSTTEQVQSMINSAKTEVEAEIPDVSGFVTSGDVEERVEGFEETTSRALNDLNTRVNSKQDTLVSGTNIKTINNESIIGSGNIEISTGTTYSAGTNIDITNNTISVTGITIPDVSQFITSGQAQSQIDSAIETETARTESTYLKEHQSLSAYSTTVEVESMINSAKTEVEAEIPDISNFVTSAQVETQITDKGYATTSQVNTAISSATQDMATTGDLSTLKTDIEGEIPTKVSDLTNDAGYLTQHQSLSGLFASVNYVSSAKTIYFYDKLNTQVGSVDATDFIKDGMVDNVYISGGSLCISFNTDSGKETITIPLTDIFNPNNYYDKTAIDNIIATETARTESTYIKEHQSLSAYSTTQEMNTAISNATSGKQDTLIAGTNIDITNNTVSVTGITIPDVSQFITSGQAQSQIDSAITAETARTENVYAKKTDIPVVPTSNTAFTNDAGYITEDALDGYATEEWVEGKGYLTEHQSLSAYSTTQQMNTAISNATSGKQDTLVSGTNIKTVNNQSILGAGNIEISGGTSYSAGTNIDITNNTISVTGITIPDVSQFITSGQAQSQIDSTLQEYDALLPAEISNLGFIKNDDTTDVNIIDIRVLTQSAYDNLVSTSSVSETTIYIIKN